MQKNKIICKFLSAISASLFVFSLVACGDDSSSASAGGNSGGDSGDSKSVSIDNPAKMLISEDQEATVATLKDVVAGKLYYIDYRADYMLGEVPSSSGQNVRFQLIKSGRKGDIHVQKKYRYNPQRFIS